MLVYVGEGMYMDLARLNLLFVLRIGGFRGRFSAGLRGEPCTGLPLDIF